MLAVMMGGSSTGSAVVTNKSTRGSSGTLLVKCENSYIVVSNVSNKQEEAFNNKLRLWLLSLGLEL